MIPMLRSRVLKHLAHLSSCPTCGASIQSETFAGRTHCNGQQFESIRFQCDSVIEWVPNFDRSEIQKPCPKSPESIAKKSRQSAIGIAIWDAVKHFDLTTEETTRIRHFIKYEWS